MMLSMLTGSVYFTLAAYVVKFWRIGEMWLLEMWCFILGKGTLLNSVSTDYI